jgi:PKD repeat protein
MSGAASTDADSQVLTYAWTFGDGTSATGASVTHSYATGGVYPVRLIVTDPLGLADTVTTTATVLTQAQGVALVQGMIDQLATDGDISNGHAASLMAKLNAAVAAFNSGRSTPAVNQLNAILNEIADLLASGRISASDAEELTVLITRIIESV